jgi:hypothetical protein
MLVGLGRLRTICSIDKKQHLWTQVPVVHLYCVFVYVSLGLYFFECDYDTHERFTKALIMAQAQALAQTAIEAFISHCYDISNSNTGLAMSKLNA